MLTKIPLQHIVFHQRKSLRRGGGLHKSPRYFLTASALAASALAASALAYLRRNRSTRPAVSTSFCLPVKNGWQLEQISRLILPLCVERVVKVLPHAQCTRTSLYAG